MMAAALIQAHWTKEPASGSSPEMVSECQKYDDGKYGDSAVIDSDAPASRAWVRLVSLAWSFLGYRIVRPGGETVVRGRFSEPDVYYGRATADCADASAALVL